MTDEENTEETKKSSGSKGMMIVLIVLILVLILGLGGLGFFVYSKGLLSNDTPNDTSLKVEEKEKKDPSEMFKATVDDLVLNITNAKGREKLMKLSFTVKSIEPSIAGIVESNKAEIIDIVIAQISARTSEELLTVGGKILLKEELKEEINKIINEVVANDDDIQQNNVKKILFTTFVIK